MSSDGIKYIQHEIRTWMEKYQREKEQYGPQHICLVRPVFQAAKAMDLYQSLMNQNGLELTKVVINRPSGRGAVGGYYAINQKSIPLNQEEVSQEEDYSFIRWGLVLLILLICLSPQIYDLWSVRFT